MKHRQEQIVTAIRSRPLTAVAVVGVLSLGAGLWIDAQNFIVGILAGVGALAATIFAATFFFDEFAERRAAARRQQKWNTVRVATMTAIWDQVRRMTLPISMRSPKGNFFIISYHGQVAHMKDVSEWTSTQAKPFDKSDDLEAYEKYKADMVRLYRDVFREHSYLRDVLTPRVLEFADDANLAGLLFALDDMERQWSSSVFIADAGETLSSWRNYPSSVWKDVHDFCSATIKIAERLADEPDLPPPRTLEINQVTIDGVVSFRARTLYE